MMPDDFCLAVDTYGLRIGVIITAKELCDEALLRLPPVWASAPWQKLDRVVQLESECGGPNQGERRYRVVVDGETDLEDGNADQALDRFEDAIQYYVAEFAKPWLFVHAGVVGWRGRAILLPGRSFSGKSTLVHALVGAGAIYYSDEYAVLDAEGRVWPYRRRLSLREGPYGEARRVTHTPAHQDVSTDQPLEVGHVALLRYDAEAGWDVERISSAQAVMGLCDNTVAIQRRPEDALTILGKVAEGAAAIQGTRGEIEAAARFLLSTTC